MGQERAIEMSDAALCCARGALLSACDLVPGGGVRTVQPQPLSMLLPSATERRRALRYALVAAAAYAIYSWLTTREEEEEEEEEVAAEAAPQPEPAMRARRPSFAVTDEQGNTQGAVADARAQSWGWLVDEERPSERKKASLLKQNEAEREARLGAMEPPAGSRKSVKFRLDTRSNFYGFVFNYDGVCVAHGADSSFVGLHLTAVLQRTRNTDVDGAELHRRFVAAAEAGGDWVSYAWRNDAQSSVRLKGAYITPLKSQWGMSLYAGVGYSLVPPPPDELSSGLYGFVCDTKGVLLAHGASAAFVGKSLAQIIAQTGNDQIDSDDLLRRFVAAARLGGGWVTYPWRNDAAAPLRQKGAYISSIERPAPHRHGSAPAHGMAYPVEMDGRSGMEVLLAGVGYFGELSRPATEEGPCLDGDMTAPPTPPPVPPSAAAAKAATAALKSLVLNGSGGGGGGGELSQQALAAAVNDASGALAAAAAEVTCWEATELPESLAGLLREHATGHIRSFDSAAVPE